MRSVSAASMRPSSRLTAPPPALLPFVNTASLPIIKDECMLMHIFRASGKGRLPLPKRMNFRKNSKGGWGGGGVGSFSIQKFILQIFAIIDDTSVMNFRKNLQYNFPKMRGGGGQRPFGTFPKIHPFWKG